MRLRKKVLVQRKPSKGTDMAGEETILDDISNALDDWLIKINILEERQFKLSNLQERVTRTLQQIQCEGLVSSYDVERLRYIGQIWIDLIDLLKKDQLDQDAKRLIINNLIKLYDTGQISVDLITEIIMKL